MNPIRLYLDEDVMDRRLAQALWAREVDVVMVADAGQQGRSDED